MGQPTNPAAPPAPVDLDALEADLAEIQRSEQFKPLPLPWSVWTSCSFRRVGCDATMADGDVLHGVVHHHDGHPDLSMGESRLKAWIALTNALPTLIAEARAKRAAEQERDEAQLRLGTLGLKPNLAPDLVDLVARLGTMENPTPTVIFHRNPDGPDAAAAIEGLNARVKALEEALRPFIKH